MQTVTTSFDRDFQLAQNGDPEAQIRIAEAWSTGEGAPYLDEKEAFHWYKAASKQGNAIAKYKHASALYWGIGTERNDSEYEIDSLLYESAHAGVAEAQFMIAYFKLNFWCQNCEISEYWYRKAANQNHAFSQYCLARFVLQEAVSFSGDKKNEAIAEGLDWLRKAACSGVYVAAYQLAKMFELGLGGIKQDQNEADKWQAVAEHNMQMYKQSKSEDWTSDFFKDSLFIIAETDVDKIMQQHRNGRAVVD